MCNGFGLIVNRNADGNGFGLHFCEPETGDYDCSHSEILYRLDWKDTDDPFNRQFVRIEYKDWTEDSFQFDEWGSVPTWAEESYDEIKAACDAVLLRVQPFIDEYKAAVNKAIHRKCDYVDEKLQPFLDAFNAASEKRLEANNAMRNGYSAESLAAKYKADNEYNEAYANYDKAREHFDAIARGVKTRANKKTTAWIVERISGITGYVPAKQ